MAHRVGTNTAVVAQQAQQLYRNGGECLECPWTFSLSGPHGREEIGGFDTINMFWRYVDSMGDITQMASGHLGSRLELFRSGVTADEMQGANVGGGKFTLRNRYGNTDFAKVWHTLTIAAVGCQLDYSSYLLGATITFKETGSVVDVWVRSCVEQVVFSLKFQLGQITSMTEGQDAWVDYSKHEMPRQPVQPLLVPSAPLVVPIVPSLESKQQGIVAPTRPVRPRTHKKSRSHPQTVSQAFLDAAVEERNQQRQQQQPARTDAVVDSYIPKKSLAASFEHKVETTVPPPPRNKDQTPPAFAHNGSIYPAGLSRKQRRSVQFSGMQGHQDTQVPEGVFIGADVPDGPMDEATYEALLQRKMEEDAERRAADERDVREKDFVLTRTFSCGSLLSYTSSSMCPSLRRSASSPTLASASSHTELVPAVLKPSCTVAMPEGLANISVKNWADDSEWDSE